MNTEGAAVDATVVWRYDAEQHLSIERFLRYCGGKVQ
jgi:hypothetical protein